MARKVVAVPDMVFEDENAVPSNAGRKTNVPDALLAVVESLAPKSLIVANEDDAKSFRALVRSAAGLLERRTGRPFGAKTAQETLSDGRIKVYFQGRMKESGEQE
jgi:hypothetical protein